MRTAAYRLQLVKKGGNPAALQTAMEGRAGVEPATFRCAADVLTYNHFPPIEPAEAGIGYIPCTNLMGAVYVLLDTGCALDSSHA